MHDPVILEILRSSRSWDGASLPASGHGKTEFRVLLFKMSPGVMTSVHMHPLNGAGYVIKGELTMYATQDPHGSFADSKRVKKVKLRSGEGWAETVNTWHYGINEGSDEVEFVLIFVGEEGTPPTLSLGTKLQ